jgi:hypothetical protein
MDTVKEPVKRDPAYTPPGPTLFETLSAAAEVAQTPRIKGERTRYVTQDCLMDYDQYQF